MMCFRRAAVLAAFAVAAASAYASPGVDGAVNRSKISIAKTFKITIDTRQSVPEEQVSIIYFVLSNTLEDNIHKMRGQTENKVYVTADGREAVYDKNGRLVSDGYNDGTYNYGSYDKPLKKFALDILPWLKLGQSEWDPTSFTERLFYYLQDLEYGIYCYVTRDEGEPLRQVAYRDLNAFEKQVVHLFRYILFNQAYRIELGEESRPRLRDDEEFYWEYVAQIFTLFGLGGEE